MPPLLLLASPHSVPVTAVSGHRPTAHLRYPPRLPQPNPKPNPRRLPPPLKCAALPSATSPHPPRNPNPSLVDGFLLVVSFLGILPRDSPERWRRLLAISEEAESRLAGIPPHLIHAITSSEDRRFFFHPGVDCHGISRAIVKYPNGGGGSTITQQLMKRIFLTSERKISRKFIEGLLSLLIEKRMSKTKIFYSYLSTMYWGHGMFGIESASSFYFQKQPIFLTVGESALLAGILPAPEILNPFTDPRRGKSSQQRVLRRMVAEGFLDMETALKVAKQPLRLHKENKEVLV
ncbi:uncharacterized protein LOC109711206 isoform X2 [Ananas comosus]|uniref:Uncharacterized protein LOC109711206 isoform X2 n=1 Tax=Ananas comosus TaxID=4615 RepID=A0A6P5F8A6_ANACO|nr:uncharacterized protein LOC109711206 isoform X2 [Ananas comosus]